MPPESFYGTLEFYRFAKALGSPIHSQQFARFEVNQVHQTFARLKMQILAQANSIQQSGLLYYFASSAAYYFTFPR